MIELCVAQTSLEVSAKWLSSQFRLIVVVATVREAAVFAEVWQGLPIVLCGQRFR